MEKGVGGERVDPKIRLDGKLYGQNRGLCLLLRFIYLTFQGTILMYLPYMKDPKLLLLYASGRKPVSIGTEQTRVYGGLRQESWQ